MGKCRLAKPLTMRMQLLLLAVLIGAGSALWAARDQVSGAVARIAGVDTTQTGKKTRGKKPRGVPVIVARIEQARNDEIVAAIGTARARRSVMIRPKTDGVIVDFRAKAGDRVRKGDTLFKIDSKQAELAARIAEKKLKEAERLLERSNFLNQNKVNSQAKVDDAATTVERAALELQQARETLTDLDVKAPFDGVVGIPSVETGERVTTASSIISLDMRGELLVEFEVAEKYSAKIAVGDEISALTPSHQDQRFAGKIQYIDSRIDPVSRTVKVRAIIPNQKDLLRPGMSFAVELELAGKIYPAIPELSLQWRKGESFVWIIEQDKAKKVLVRTIKRLNSVILVEGKIKPGDLIVVEGVQRLRPGRAVSHKAPRPFAPPAAQKDRSAETLDREQG